MSPNVLRAFENAEDEVMMNTLKGAPRLDAPSLFRPQFMTEVQKEHPENASRSCFLKTYSAVQPPSTTRAVPTSVSWIQSRRPGGARKSRAEIE